MTQPTVSSQLWTADKYKQFCIWTYSEWDVIEVLVCNDVDDWYRYAPETQYWYVSKCDLIRMSVFAENTTWEVLRLWEVKTNNPRKTYWQLSDFWDFDSSYIIQDRKIEVIPHPHFQPYTVEREPILFTQPT